VWPSCHRGEEVVPLRWCRVLLHTPGDSETEYLLEEVVDDGLDDDDPFLVKRLIVLFHMVAANPGFSISSKARKYYFEYGL
jgi:hypothetical protein